MKEFSAYLGLDVHRDTIEVAVAHRGREEPVYRGKIKNQRRSVQLHIHSLSAHGVAVSICYEAGPSGYGLSREIIDTGHHCEVVTPSPRPWSTPQARAGRGLVAAMGYGSTGHTVRRFVAQLRQRRKVSLSVRRIPSQNIWVADTPSYVTP